MKISQGIGWMPDEDQPGYVRSATPGEYAAEIERLRAALTAMRARFVKDRDASQSDQCFGFASLLQTYINEIDAYQQQGDTK